MTANLTVLNLGNPNRVGPGGFLTYSLLVRNNGDTAASGIEVVETLPPGFTIDRIMPGGGNFAGSETSPGVVTFSGGTIPAGSSALLTIHGIVSQGATGSIQNVAVVDPNDTIEEGENENDNAYTLTTTIDPNLGPDLRIFKIDSADPVAPGDSITYSLLVRNDGLTTATNINVRDSLPTDFTVSQIATQGDFVASQTGNVITFTGGSLATGESVIFTIVGTTPTTPGEITNIAVVDPDGNITESNENNNIFTATTTLDTALLPDLTITVNSLTTFDTTPELTGTISDNSASIQVTVNSNNYAATNNADGTWTLADNSITPALSGGKYDIAVTATDTLGNMGNDSTSNELTIEVASVTIAETTGSTDVTEGGATDTYMVVLDDQPTGDVTVNITPDAQTSVDPTSLTFNSSNWNSHQTVTVTADDDSTVEGDHTSTITHAIAPSSAAEYVGVSINNVTVNITDNDFNEITGGGGSQTLTGTDGPDRITGGRGRDNITGGGGSDEFVYTDYRDGGDTITDFIPGQDKIDLSAVLTQIGYSGSSPIGDGYISFREVGGNTIMQIDVDGPAPRGRARGFLLLPGVAAAALNNSANFIFN